MNPRVVKIALAALLLVPVVLLSCTKASGIPSIECVPDDAVVVKSVNLDGMLKAAGCPLPFAADTLASVEAGIVDLVVEPDFRNAFVAVIASGGVDASDVTCFITASGSEVVMVPVSDAAALKSGVRLMAGEADFVNDKELVCVPLCGCVVAVARGHCFIAHDAEVIKGALRKAHDNHFGTLLGVREFLSGSSMARLAVNCGRSSLSSLGGSDKWLCAGLDVSAASVSAEAVVMDRDGKLDSIGRNFREIDIDFLRYTPQDAAVVLAYGKFSGNERGLSMLLGRFAPVYLKQADGTTSLYALPAGRAQEIADASPGAWNVETMVHVPEHLVPECINQYKERARGKAIDIGNQWMYREGGNSYFFGAFDGSVVFSTNREISAEYNNSFTEDFLGKRAAMIIDIPYGSVLSRAWGVPYGLCFKIGVEEMKVKARITFSGTTDTPLAALLRLPQLPDFKARFHAYTGR